MHNVIRNLSKSAFNLAQQILGHQDDAADVLHDAVQVALSHGSVPDHRGNEFKPWFFRVVRNKAIDKYRNKKVQKPVEAELDELPGQPGQCPERQAEQSQQHGALRAALDSLPLEQREIILLRDFHGMSYLEIAEVTGIKQGSVMSRLHRARMALKSAFDKRY